MNKLRSSIVFIMIFLVFSIIITIITACSSPPSKYDDFAKCLTEKGTTMYGTSSCSHCKNQKAMFGSSFQYINYVDCEKYETVCKTANLEGYPTWNINGKNHAGELTFYNFSKLSGCSLDLVKD